MVGTVKSKYNKSDEPIEIAFYTISRWLINTSKTNRLIKYFPKSQEIYYPEIPPRQRKPMDYKILDHFIYTYEELRSKNKNDEILFLGENKFTALDFTKILINSIGFGK